MHPFSVPSYFSIVESILEKTLNFSFQLSLADNVNLKASVSTANDVPRKTTMATTFPSAVSNEEDASMIVINKEEIPFRVRK